MKTPITLSTIGLFALAASHVQADNRNVIVVLADDYSYGEHSMYGNQVIKTPHLDKLASESVCFDNFHVGATSAPTRAQLMTGKHEFRVGVTHTKYPRAYLNLEEKIWPQYFAEVGYETGHFGKWHLGNDVFDDEYSPRARGFKTSIVSDYRQHFNPEMLCNGQKKAYTGYRTDILFDEAQSWMTKQLKQDKPFLCYIATNSAHKPFACPSQYKDMYAGKLKSKEADLYYGMVSNIDDNMGELIAFMKQKGIYDNTILVYMTDNGHVTKEYNAGMRGNKGSQYRGGTRVPCFFHCPDAFRGGRVVNDLTGGVDFLPTMLDLCELPLDKAIDGTSLKPLLDSDTAAFPDRFMVCHVGRWKDGEADKHKYIKYAVQNKRYRLVDNKALYDIQEDPGEKINVIDQHPKLVQDMRAFYEKWWATTRPLMINEARALREGGSRLSIEDEAFRKQQAQQAPVQRTVDLPLILDMVHHNPGDAKYDTQYNDPRVMKDMGYNGKVYFLFESPMLGTTWESVDPHILPKGTPDRAWVDAQAAAVRERLKACRQAGISTWAMSDLILFPKRLIKKYGIAKTFGNPNNPLIEKLLRAQINEVFDQFPNLDGLVTRIGETYLHDAPYHQGAIDHIEDAEKTIIPLMQILREEICVKRNKMLVFRTWRSFDEKLDTYEAVSAAIAPHPNLVFSVKHCEGDFHRANPFSKVIGAGRHPQIIEVQCAREYEGKGAYPNYVAHGVIEGFEEHAHMPAESISSIRQFANQKAELYAGIWTWTRGGGWEGPYIKNELWPDLNAWVMAQWAKDPTQSEEVVFTRYALERLHLKLADVPTFRKLCLLSAEAVVRGRNTTHGDMLRFWTRDEGIGWPQLRKGHYDRILNQKDEAVAKWKTIVELAKSIEWADNKTRQHVISSCYYGLHLYEIYRAVVHVAVAEKRGDTTAIKKWIQVYDQAWTRYNQLSKTYPMISTLYTQAYRQRYHVSHADSEINRLRKLVN